jgi:hypothetical protein
MSIKQIDNEFVGSDTGVAKRINRGAEKLVFDILQATQYSTPIPSTVRELVTNACDSQREKEIAIEILTGQKTVEDYYINREGEQYEDSNFDASYYSITNLDVVNNHVDVYYKHNAGVGYCDEFTIKDYGVGIGGRRLEGILELGYSTKRNTSENFGAFGLGAKVALSTGVDFYTIETVYNGKRFKANCFNYKTDFLIPRFNLSTGQENPYIEFTDGTKVYYEPANELNRTEISFKVKKHNADRFIDAVSEQLTYLSNVRFYEVQEDATQTEVDFKPSVIYNSKHLIITESNYYARPHIVIVKAEGSTTGINYGHVDFRELEMEQLYGAVGLKCPIRQVYKNEQGEEVVMQDGVDVTPSREKVIWSDHTKQFVQNLILKAGDEATELVQERLNETDFLKWLEACKNVVFSGKLENEYSTNGKVLQAMSRIIDTKSLKPVYPVNKRIKFEHMGKVFEGFNVKLHTLTNKLENGEFKIVSNTTDVDTWEKFDIAKVYFRKEGFTRLKDAYLMKENGGSFISIKKKSTQDLEDKCDDPSTRPEDLVLLEAQLGKIKKNQLEVEKYLSESESYRVYDDVIVPDDFEASLKEEEEVLAATGGGTQRLTPAELRELNKQIVGYTVRAATARHANEWDDSVWDKVEPRLAALRATKTVIYYGTDADGEKLKLAAEILHHFAPSIGQVYTTCSYTPPYSNDRSDPMHFYMCDPSRFTNDKGELTHYMTGPIKRDFNSPQLIKLSETNVKQVQNVENIKHIDEFFYAVDEDDNLTCSFYLRMYYAAHVMDIERVQPFFEHLQSINPLFAQIYEKLDYVKDKLSYKLNGKSRYKVVDEVFTRLNKMAALEYVCMTSPDDKEAIADTSSKLFIASDIPGAKIRIPGLEGMISFYKDFTETSQHVLSQISNYKYEDEATKREIQLYLKAKGLLEMAIPVEEIKEFESFISLNL